MLTSKTNRFLPIFIVFSFVLQLFPPFYLNASFLASPGINTVSNADADADAREQPATTKKPLAHKDPPDIGNLKRRHVLITTGIAIVSAAFAYLTSSLILYDWSNKSSEKEITTEQAIANLNASKLAKKAIFLFGEDDCYKKMLFREHKTYYRSLEDKKLYGFAELYAKAELYSIIEEALDWSRPVPYLALKRMNVDAEIEEKGREILRCRKAQSIRKKIAKAKDKNERLSIFLSILNNLEHPFRDMGFGREYFKRLLETNGLSQLIKDFPELLSLPDLLNSDLVITSWEWMSLKPEKLKKKQDKLYEITSFFNKTLFIPNGFYANPFRDDVYDAWFFRIRNRFDFEEKKVFIIERLRYNRERLPMGGFTSIKYPDATAAVFHEEATDIELLAVDDTADIEEDEEEEKEIQRQAALLRSKAKEENPELSIPGALTSYWEFSLVLHELTHIIREGTEKETIPSIAELAYGEPHFKAGSLARRMVDRTRYDSYYSKIFAPITGLETSLPESPEDKKRQKFLAVEKFISMGKAEIQERAKELLQKESPGVYEAFESKDGQRFRENTLNEIKAKNMPLSKERDHNVLQSIASQETYAASPELILLGTLTTALLTGDSRVNIDRRKLISLGLSKAKATSSKTSSVGDLYDSPDIGATCIIGEQNENRLNPLIQEKKSRLLISQAA